MYEHVIACLASVDLDLRSVNACVILFNLNFIRFDFRTQRKTNFVCCMECFHFCGFQACLSHLNQHG